MTRYMSPVNPAVYPHLAVTLLSIGLFFMAWFFVYPNLHWCGVLLEIGLEYNTFVLKIQVGYSRPYESCESFLSLVRELFKSFFSQKFAYTQERRLTCQFVDY